MKKPLLYLTIFCVILPAILILNIFFWQNTVVGIIGGCFYLLLNGFLAGVLFLNKENPGWSIFYGLLLFLCLNSLGGAIIYFFYELNNFVISALLILTPVALLAAKKIQVASFPPGTDKSSADKFQIFRQGLTSLKLKNLYLPALYLTLIAINSYLLFAHRTDLAIRSPWELLPKSFFIIYFLTTAILLVFILRNKTKLSLLFISIHSLFSLAVALIIYKLGYGYDPFIHEATEKFILNNGFISPKTPYYLGQYTLVIYLTKILSLPHEWIDKILVPLFYAVYLPATVYFSFAKNSAKKFLPLIILTIPFGVFLLTTPQGLANLLVLLIALLSYKYTSAKENINWSILLILALTAAAVHPLAGIPALCFVALLFLISRNYKKLSLFFGLLSAIALPAIFYLQSVVSNNLSTVIRFSPPNILNDWQWPVLVRKFDAVLDLVYLYAWNFNFWFIALAAVGFWLLLRQQKNTSVKIFVYSFIILIINYLLLTLFFQFQGLIAYERQNYASRILELSFYFLIPFYLWTFDWLAQKITEKNIFYKSFFILILTIAIISSFYVSYPRQDDYDDARGYNLSQADLSAVHYIKNTAGGDYIVLANQMVAAGALKEFGFAKYYQTSRGEIFYYPIPTGSPLYDYYLKMVYEKAARKTMIEAMDLVGVDAGFLVVNDYWHRSAITVEEAKSSADNFVKLDNGKIYVFEYKR
ncbi:MAG: hypothetical protein PHD51_00120 [Patescibacteria group bacterium]|nr:hypothetical protein [Patescibacteria group bacterium]MDD5490726.1 hypothetical protein [Patescibacteria group bacterium]